MYSIKHIFSQIKVISDCIYSNLILLFVLVINCLLKIMFEPSGGYLNSGA